MAVKYNKTDELSKMFDEFVIEPIGDELAKRDEAVQAEAERFIKSEQAALAKNETKKNTEK